MGRRRRLLKIWHLVIDGGGEASEGVGFFSRRGFFPQHNRPVIVY
jgi:hypothetical protein